MTGRRRARRGFTLVEAMVALVVLGLVLAVAAAALGGLGRSRARVADLADRAEVAAAVQDMLRRQVPRALPLKSGDGDGSRFRLTATADRLEFPLADPPLPGRGGLTLVGFAIEPVPGGQRLTYRQIRQAPGRADPAVTVLAEGDYRFRFAYRGDDPRQGWQAEWTDPRRWPRLIRLDISAGGRELPAIVLPVRVDTDRGCVLSLGEGWCRDREG